MREQNLDTNHEPFPQDPVEQLRWFAKHGVPAASDSDDRLIWAAGEIERLKAFRNRVVGFFNELHEDAKDEDGCRIPYMLFGNDADVLERFEKVIGDDANG